MVLAKNGCKNQLKNVRKIFKKLTEKNESVKNTFSNFNSKKYVQNELATELKWSAYPAMILAKNVIKNNYLK